MKRNSLVFGTISGLIISVFMGISMALMASSGEHSSGNSSMIIGFSAMTVAFAFVVVGMKNYRDKQNGGVLTFGQGFLLGVTISFIASTIYVLTWAVEYHYFLPDFMDKYAAMQVKELKESGVSGVTFDEAVKSIETSSYNYKHNPFVFTMYTYVEILPLGILISLISAVVLRKKAQATA